MARAELVNRFVLNKLSRAEVARPQRKKEVTSVHGGLQKLRAAVNRLPGGLNAFCGPHVLRFFATSRQELNREQGPVRVPGGASNTGTFSCSSAPMARAQGICHKSRLVPHGITWTNRHPPTERLLWNALEVLAVGSGAGGRHRLLLTVTLVDDSCRGSRDCVTAARGCTHACSSAPAYPGRKARVAEQYLLASAASQKKC